MNLLPRAVDQALLHEVKRTQSATHPSYSPELKQRLLRDSFLNERSLYATARAYGIPPTTLYRWQEAETVRKDSLSRRIKWEQHEAEWIAKRIAELRDERTPPETTNRGVLNKETLSQAISS